MKTSQNQNSIDPIEEFPKVAQMLKALAYRASETYGIAPDDALSEAHFSFLKACQSYREEKGASPSTWIHIKVWGELCNMPQRYIREAKLIDRTVDYTCPENPTFIPVAPPAQPKLDWNELGNEARLVVQMILETPEELGLSPRMIFARVKRQIIKKKKLRRLQLQVVLAELRTYFRTKLV